MSKSTTFPMLLFVLAFFVCFACSDDESSNEESSSDTDADGDTDTDSDGDTDTDSDGDTDTDSDGDTDTDSDTVTDTDDSCDLDEFMGNFWPPNLEDYLDNFSEDIFCDKVEICANDGDYQVFVDLIPGTTCSISTDTTYCTQGLGSCVTPFGATQCLLESEFEELCDASLLPEAQGIYCMVYI